MKKIYLLTALLATTAVFAPSTRAQGELSPEILRQITSSQTPTAADRALRNAMAQTDLRTLATNIGTVAAAETDFTYQVPVKGITDQKSSGRCWLFTGLNVLRAKAIGRYGLPGLELSQVYLFFYDQLEKSNLFLQGVIDTRKKAMDDRLVDWFFSNPLSDGGTFTGVADLVTKYGVVPKEAMPETYASNNTARIDQLLKLKLREYGLQLRDMSGQGASEKKLQQAKVEMLGTIYHILTLAYGVPPTEFRWTQRDKAGKAVETQSYTPQEFYRKLWDGEDLNENYVMVMNDPLREYYKVYRIEYDRHTYDGHDWLYLNLPVEEIKPMAISSIKDSTAMYFSCDVGKYLHSASGTLDIDNYDYESLLGTTFGMDKRQRVMTHASGSSHAMTMIAVDVDSITGQPRKWMVENSWGASSGWQGKLIMTDRWFDEYMFRLVFHKKYVPEKYLRMMDQKPVLLPAWDPMFQPEE